MPLRSRRVRIDRLRFRDDLVHAGGHDLDQVRRIHCAKTTGRLINRPDIGSRTVIKKAEHEIRSNNHAEQHKQPNNTPRYPRRTVLSLRDPAPHWTQLPVSGKLTLIARRTTGSDPTSPPSRLLRAAPRPPAQPLIDLRALDGNAATPSTKPPVPGIWRPAPA
jgi:hypothetical protein